MSASPDGPTPKRPTRRTAAKATPGRTVATTGGAEVVPIRPDKIGPGVLVPSTARVNITAVLDQSNPNFGLWVDGVRAADLPVVRARMPIRDSAGKRRGWQYLLAAAGDPTAYLCSSKDLTTGDYADRCGIDVPEDRTIRDACVTVIRRMARDAEQREVTAGWVDGQLCLPPVDALPPGYLETAGDEPTARRAWRRIGAIACMPGAEHLALHLGAVYAAPYPAALSTIRPVSFALVGIGGKRLGKTTNANVAAGWYGAPMPLNPVIGESPIAMTDQLAALGILPMWRDEAHAVKWRPEDWKNHWMTNLNGGGRRRSPADGTGITRHTRGWWGVQFLTGNFDPRFGATDGVAARVIALNTPHLPNGDVSDEITDRLLPDCYGWPIRWQLASHLTPEEMRKHSAEACGELLAACRANDVQVEPGTVTVARVLGLAVAGADQAGQLIDAPGLRAAAIRSALRVLGTLADAQADQPSAFGDQLHQDVMDDVQRYPGGWPTFADFERMRREDSTDTINGGRISRGEVHGFRVQVDGHAVVAMQRSVFAEMVARRDYAVSEALTELRADGRLVVNAKTGFRWAKRVNNGPVPEKFYAFRYAPTAELGEPHAAAGDQPNRSDHDEPPTTTTPQEEADTMPEQAELPMPDVDEHRAAAAAGADGAEVRDYADADPRRTLIDRDPRSYTDDELAPAITAAAELGDRAALDRIIAELELREQAEAEARQVAPVVALAPCVACGERTVHRDDQGEPRHPRCAPAAAGAHLAPSSAPGSAARGRNTRTSQVARSRGTKQAAEVSAALEALAASEPLRLLRALETTHIPRRRDDRGRTVAIYRAPELPAMLEQAHVVNSWAWQRPYTGEASVLDCNAAWPSAVSSVEIPHGELEHTGAVPYTGRPGIYEVAVHPWTEEFLPSPLGYVKPGTETVWIPQPMVKRLIELETQRRWPDVTVFDSYTSVPARMHAWAEFLKAVRNEAITKYGRDSDQYAEFKEAFGQACSLMLGTRAAGQSRQWRCDMHRPDITHAVQSQAAMKLHRWADECRMVTGNDLAPIGLQNVDEIVVPSAALEIITTKERPGNLPPLKIDPTGMALGTLKVKRTEMRENG